MNEEKQFDAVVVDTPIEMEIPALEKPMYPRMVEDSIENAPWYYSPDPDKKFHFQITTPNERDYGSFKIASLEHRKVAEHICKIHNDWLHFKWNKRYKKGNKLQSSLLEDFRLFKRGFQILEESGFDLHSLQADDVMWEHNPVTTGQIFDYINDNKEAVERTLFSAWYLKNFDIFNRMAGGVFDEGVLLELLGPFENITLFGNGRTDNTIFHAVNWFTTVNNGALHLKRGLEEALPEGKIYIVCSNCATASISPMMMVTVMFSAVSDWMDKMRVMLFGRQIGNSERSLARLKMLDESKDIKNLSVTVPLKPKTQWDYIKDDFRRMLNESLAGDRFRAVVTVNGHLKMYMSPTQDARKISRFLSAADEFAKWAEVPIVPDGKDDQYVKCNAHYMSGDCLWTFYCDLSTKHDCYKTDAPVLWDNGTYLGKEEDYLKAELQY